MQNLSQYLAFCHFVILSQHYLLRQSTCLSNFIGVLEPLPLLNPTAWIFLIAEFLHPHIFHSIDATVNRIQERIQQMSVPKSRTFMQQVRIR